MKVRVIGGGWYGCHIATRLLAAGHEVMIYERGPTLFAGASSANQSRLHLGFHYPRDGVTRASSQKGAARMMETYPFLTRPIPACVYAVARESNVDWATYRRAVEAPALECDPDAYGLTGVEGAVLTGERIILEHAAQKHFTAALQGRVLLGQTVHDPVADEAEWDAQIDCTFGALGNVEIEAFEPCVTWTVESAQPWLGLTIMDGPFGSVMPYWANTNQSTVTTVPHTPLTRTLDAEVARDRVREFLCDAHRRHVHWTATAETLRPFIRNFDERYKPIQPLVGIRARPYSRSDGRRLEVTRSGSLIAVRPGKIDAIFDAADRVMAMLG